MRLVYGTDTPFHVVCITPVVLNRVSTPDFFPGISHPHPPARTTIIVVVVGKITKLCNYPSWFLLYLLIADLPSHEGSLVFHHHTRPIVFEQKVKPLPSSIPLSNSSDIYLAGPIECNFDVALNQLTVSSAQNNNWTWCLEIHDNHLILL